jgi:cell division protein FtsB
MISSAILALYHGVRAHFDPNTGLRPADRGRLGAVVSSSADVLLRTLPVAMLSLAVVAVPVLVLEPDGLPRLRALQQELSDVEQQNDELRRDVARLRVEVAELRDDPATIERIARSELGLVRKSEVVFEFEP